MLPDFEILYHRYSTSPFITDSHKVYPYTTRYEIGGVDISDGSEGINKYVWIGKVIDGSMNITRQDDPTYTFTLNLPDHVVIDFDFTFDQNNRPNFTFTNDKGLCYVTFFDPTINDYRTLILANYRSPRISMDDKRYFNQTRSDILLFGLYNDKLVYRIQRERFTVQRILAHGDYYANKVIRKIGMTTTYRFGIQLEDMQ